MHRIIFALMAMLFISAGQIAAKPVCIDVDGEAAIVKGDLPSARTEAVSRARWSAVEQVAGVEIKGRTVVSDAMLLEDLITTQARGAVTSSRILGEQKGTDTIRVRINACVEPDLARNALTPLAMNSSVSLFIPAMQIKHTGYEESTVFTESLSNALIQRGFTVLDLAQVKSPLSKVTLERALNTGDFLALRSLVYRYHANTILVGKIESTHSTAKGENVGYGISMPFNKVTVRLVYRLLTRGSQRNMRILASGTATAVGVAPHTEDARNAALNNLAEQAVPEIMEKINQRMHELANKITVVVDNVTTPEHTFAVRDQLRQIAWVGEISEEGIGRLKVTFPENPFYLANGLAQKGFQIIQYANDIIRVRQR